MGFVLYTQPASHPPHSTWTVPGGGAMVDEGHALYFNGEVSGAPPPSLSHHESDPTHNRQPASANGHVAPPRLSQHASDPTDKRQGRKAHRRVEHLTEEQLEKKRKNDRESQKAHRQRIRHKLARLQTQLATRDGDADADAIARLQVALRENEALKAELRVIKARIQENGSVGSDGGDVGDADSLPTTPLGEPGQPHTRFAPKVASVKDQSPPAPSDARLKVEYLLNSLPCHHGLANGKSPGNHASPVQSHQHPSTGYPFR